jgi:hypothetical protein
MVVMNEHIACWDVRVLNRRARQSALRELAVGEGHLALSAVNEA